MPAPILDFTAVTVFNGWNIVQLPTSPGFRTVEFAGNDSVSESKSPFSQQSQYQYWSGADWWEGTLSLPAMKRDKAAQWMAFLLSLRGKANCFLVGDPYQRDSQGNPQGVPVVDGSDLTKNLQMTSAFVTKGWRPAQVGLLVPGDHIQVGYRLHVVMNTVNSDGNGAATIQVWPSLREQPVDGTSVIVTAPKGLFRLAENKRMWSVSETRLFGISFKVKEAR